jgi:hypothetical protein
LVRAQWIGGASPVSDLLGSNQADSAGAQRATDVSSESPPVIDCHLLSAGITDGTTVYTMSRMLEGGASWLTRQQSTLTLIRPSSG